MSLGLRYVGVREFFHIPKPDPDRVLSSRMGQKARLASIRQVTVNHLRNCH